MTNIPQTIQGWLVRLYTAETKLARMKAANASPEDLERSKAWLLQQWEMAKGVGVSEKMFSAYGEALYLEAVSIALEHSFRDDCACHAEYEKSGQNRDPLRPCCHFDDAGCCSPFCPKFDPIAQHSDLSSLAGQS